MCKLFLWTFKEAINALSICEIIFLHCLSEKGKGKIEEILDKFERETSNYGFIGKHLFSNTLKSLEFQSFVKIRKVNLNHVNIELSNYLRRQPKLVRLLEEEIKRRTGGLKPEVFRKILNAIEFLRKKDNGCVKLKKLQTVLQNYGVSKKEFEVAVKKLLEWGFLYKPNQDTIQTIKLL